MPAGPRIRANFAYGTTTDNPLTAGATTFNSAELPTLPVVSSAHAVVTLDPRRVFGEPEIVVVTTHTAAATVATITRGQYGTVARSHPQGTEWVHSPIDEDYIEILTSSTRPSDPYGGQVIFETDTNIYVARDAANSVWVEGLPIGAWKTWTPTLGNLTVGSGTVAARFVRVGRKITYHFKFTLGAGSAVGLQPSFTLPVSPHADYQNTAGDMGSVHMLDAATNSYGGIARKSVGDVVQLFCWAASGAVILTANISATVPFTWGTGDIIDVSGTYEAAS